MFTLILFGGLGLILLIAGIIVTITDKHSNLPDALFFGGGTFLFIELILCMSLININAKFNTVISTYDNTAALVASYEGYEFGNMQSLTEQVIAINNTIAKHRGHMDSKWTGLWCSREIGNLEPIVFNQSPYLK